MKAVLCEQWAHYSALRVRDMAPPTLGAGQVRIAVHYATVGFGQTLIVAGKYQRKPPLPFVPGTEVSGIVLEVAPGVRDFAPGDRVVAGLDWGGYAEQAVASAATTWPVPDGVSLAAAVSVPLGYGTAYAALHWRGRIRAGETLLVHGAAGGVGLAAVQLGRLAGATVIAIAGTEARVQLARDHGAHHGLVHGGDNLSRRVRELNGGRNVELVFDPVGGSLFDEALRCLAPEGRILVIGFASGEVPRVAANLLLVKNAEIIGFNFGLYIGWGLTDEREHYKERLRAMMRTLFGHVERGELKPPDVATHALDEIVAAFDAVVERRSVGRAVLRIGAAPAAR